MAVDMMLLPQDHQRRAATLEFFVHLRPVGQRLRRALMEARRREQPPLQLGVADLPFSGGIGHVIPTTLARFTYSETAVLPTPVASRTWTHAQPQLMRQPQHLTDLPHRHSHPCHRLPLLFLTGTADLLIRMSTGALSKRSSETVRNHRNAVRDAPERLSAMDPNLHVWHA